MPETKEHAFVVIIFSKNTKKYVQKQLKQTLAEEVKAEYFKSVIINPINKNQSNNEDNCNCREHCPST